MARRALPTPLSAFDVAPDGRAAPAPDLRPEPAPETAYRWLRLSFDDPALRAWAAAALPPTIGASLSQRETRPRFAPQKGWALLNLRGVNQDEGDPGDRPEELVSIRLCLRPGLVVSVERRPLEAAERLAAACAASAAPPALDGFLVALVSAITDRAEDALRALEARADAAEAADEADPALLDEVARLRSLAARLRRYFGPQRDALQGLAAERHGLLGQAARDDLEELANTALRLVEELDEVRERMAIEQDQIAGRREEVMQRHQLVLSVVAAIFLPLTFLTGLLGMNVEGIPYAERAWAFAGVVGVSLAISVALLAFFKWRRWM